MTNEYKIQGYDKVLGEMYTLPETYKTREEAKRRCRSNESPVKA